MQYTDYKRNIACSWLSKLFFDLLVKGQGRSWGLGCVSGFTAVLFCHIDSGF